MNTYLLHREDEQGLFSVTKEQYITYVAYSSMSRGILKTLISIPLKETDWRRTNSRFNGEYYKNN